MSKDTKTNTHQQQAARTAKNWVDYESLKQQLTLDAVLAHYNVSLRGTGEQKSGFCPLPTHQSKTTGKKSPSFSAHAGKGAWHCFGCGAKGNALELAVRLEGHAPDDPADFRDGTLAVRDAFGLGPPTNSSDAESSGKPQGRRKPSEDAKPAPKAKRRQAGRKQPHSTPSTSPPVGENDERVEEEEDTGVEELVNAPLDFELQHLDPDHPYLAERGFEPETVEHFGLGYCGKGLMKGRIAIPVRDEEGHLVAYAGRLVDDEAVDADAPKYRFPGPVERDGGSGVVRREFRKSLVLYHACDLWPRRQSLATVYVVEGFPACWHLWQMGLRDTVAVMGSSCSDRQAELLAALVGPANPGEPSGRLVLVPDGDAGGRQLAADLLPKLAPHAWCRVVELPDGTQPTDFDRDGLREHWK